MPEMHRGCRFDPWVRKIPWKRKQQPTPLFLPGQRSPWWAGITDSMDMTLSKLREVVEDRESWQASVHGVPKSRT